MICVVDVPITYLTNRISGLFSFLTPSELVFGFWMTTSWMMGRQNPRIAMRGAKFHFSDG